MLTATEKREALEAIDWLIDYLFVPVTKAEWKEYVAVETALADRLLGAWGEQVKAALKSVAETVTQLPEEVTPEHVQLLMGVLGHLLGDELAEKVAPDVGKYMAAAYAVGKNAIAKKLGVAVGTGLIDEAAVAVMKKHTVYWIGSHFDTELSQAIEAIVRTTMIEAGMGRAEAAQYLQAALGGQFARSEDYWRGLAAVAANRSRNLGHVQGFVDAGVTVYEVVNPMDERTSDICRVMNGKRLYVSDAVKHRDAILAAQTPEEIKTIAPWRRVKQDPAGGPGSLLIRDDNGSWVKFDWGPRKLAQKGMSLPPYHFHCRSTIVAVEFDTSGIGVKPVPIVFKPLPKPKDPFPPVSQLKKVGSGSYLGGAGEKWIYEDAAGRKYIFKPAVAKSGGKPEPFRAYVQEAVSQVQARVLGEQFVVPIKAVEVEGRFGTIQPLLSDVKGDLKKIPLADLTPDQLRMVQQEHVIDWLVGNFDSHPGNHIVLADGRIIGIDKEQAFRYIADPKSWRVSTTYHPNAVYGEAPPIGNTLYSAFAKKEVDLNPNDILPVIQRIEAIPDDEYRELFRAYAEALHGKGEKAEALLDQIVKRKQVVRAEFEAFFSELLTERTGKAVTFKFVDAVPAKELTQQIVTAQAFSKETLEQLTWKELWDLAKPHKIKYAQSWSKEDFIRFLMDPSQKAAIEEEVRNRIRAQAAARAARRARQASDISDDWAVGDEVFSDLSKVREIRRSPYGVSFHRDAAAIEGQVVTVREVAGDGFEGYMLDFKVTREKIPELREAMERAGATPGTWRVYENGMNYESGRFELRNPVDDYYPLVHVDNPALILERDGVRIEFWASDELAAMQGTVRVTVSGDGAEAARRLKAALEQVGLAEVVAAPTEETARYFALRRLLWQHDPQADLRITRGEWKPTLDELEAYLKGRGVRTDGLRWKEVFPGYSTYVDESIDWEKDHGVAYLWAGLGTHDPERLIRVLRSTRTHGGGMMSSKARMDHGILTQGASVSSDFLSGGADSVFLRLVTRNQVGKGRRYSQHFMGGGIRVHFDPKILQRTDWYAQAEDTYGHTWGPFWERRKSGVEFVKGQASKPTYDNEVMMRRGVSIEYLTEITVDTEWDRETVIQALRADGWETINGKPVEEIVKVRSEI